MAEPVLLIHSGGFSSRQWRKLAERLAPAHAVIAPELVGGGAARDLEMLEPLLAEPAHVVGHSYGGFLALKLALAHPDRVRSLSVYEPVAFGILDEDADADALAILHRVDATFDVADPDAWLSQFVDWWNGAGAWSTLPEDTRAAFRATGWKTFQEVVSLMADRTDGAAYRRIAAPTLLLGGERTPLPERRVLDKLAAALPRAKLLMFSDMGHMGPITHASLVNTAILAHIASS